MTQPNQPQTSQEQGPSIYTIASCDLDGKNLGLRVYLEKPYWASKDVNWKYFEVIKLSEYQSLQQKVSELEAENKRLHNLLLGIHDGCNYQATVSYCNKCGKFMHNEARKALKSEGVK